MKNENPQNYAIFILRVSLGIMLLSHGLLKVLVFTIPGTVGFFASIGLPASVAYLTIFGELAAGIALILGTYTRLVALLALPILLGATWAHSGNGWLFSNPNGGWEFPLYLSVNSLALIFLGNGTLALKKFPLIDNFIPNFFKA